MNLHRNGGATDAAETYVIHRQEPPLFAVAPVAAVTRGRRRWPFVVAGVALAVAVALAGAAAYLLTRGPDLAAFHSGLQQTAELSLSMQAQTERLDANATLPVFRSALTDTARRFDVLEQDAQAVNDTRHRLALLAAIDAGKSYAEELGSLTLLDRTVAPAGRDAHALELASDAERAYEAAATLDSDPATVRSLTLTPTPLATVLAERHEAWTNYEQKLATATALRRQQQAKLVSLQGFTNQMDGIIARYQDSRTQLANWIEGVNTQGATYTEAYGVLYQQEEQRSKLRDDLTLLHAPPAFVADQQTLLGIMDDSVSALSAASRGISEYQSDDGYGYPLYSDTPGWLSFEQTSDEIADRLDQELGSYNTRKHTLVASLSRPIQLPNAPGN